MDPSKWSLKGFLLGFGVSEDVGLEVGGLGKLFVAAVKGADVGTVSRVDPDVGPEVKVQGEPLPASYNQMRVKHEFIPGRQRLWFSPSKVHWKGFSPVWTSWCRLSLEDSTKAFPHSAQTWTLGPWVWRCFRMAELSRNILVQPL